MREIIVADAQGFCWGVRRALDIVEQHQEVSILGHLIHNKQVVERLEKDNKKVISEVNDSITTPVVITAHGTKKENFEKLDKLGVNVVDTTCPLVSVIYTKGERLEKEGYHILIIGDKNHIEVQGIASRLHNPIIIKNEEELAKVTLPEKIGIICQSTFSTKKFDSLVKLIEDKAQEVKARNTICSPTLKRQAAAEELAQKVDLMIVIGGYHSSNTKKLAILAKDYVPTHHIEQKTELKKEWFEEKQKIGITAGASTPEWIINDVCKEIASYDAPKA